ncbi:MAG: mechanosensitive ion channel domain-containing protein [Verrucomicrobiota bacterium]
MKFKTYLTIFTLSLGVLGPQAHAQLEKLLKGNATTEKATKKSTVQIGDQLEIWKKQVGEDLARLAKFSDEATLPSKITQADLDNRKRTLERTQSVIDRHVEALKSIEENKLALDAAKTSIADWNGYGDTSPKSMLVVDELNNRKLAVAERKASDQSSLEIYERTLSEWVETSKIAEEKISLAQKAYDSSGDQNHTALWHLESEKEKQRLLFIQSSALQQAIAALKINIKTHEAESGLLEKKIREASRTAVLSEEDIAQIKAASSDRQKALRTETEALRSRQSKASEDEAKALANLVKIKAAESPDPVEVELAEFTYEAAQARVTSLQQMINSLESFSQIEAFIPEAYEHRMILLNPKSSGRERKESIAALTSLQQRLTAWEIVSNNELKSITAAINNGQARATAFPADDSRLKALNRIRTALWERQSLIQRLTQSISTQVRTLDNWLLSYLSVNKEAWYSKVSDSFLQFWDSMKRIWNISVNQYEEVIEKDGQRIVQIRNVSLGSIITALIMFAIAYLIASTISRRLQHMVVRRGVIGENQARTLKNWIMLLVALLLAFSTLSWLNIPLTIFAFLAGALAIGVGFGTQTIIKNFISGIILLFERKVRVGDIVEVDNTMGVVSEINTRSSIVRGLSGIESIIPNSLFLENRVVNWTLNNRLLRREIAVGVAYGSQPQEVLKILMEVAERHGLVLDNPEPVATFSNFGENSLDFTLYFWVEINERNNRLVIDSDLRIMIEKRLTDAGIAVPFPQRDVHLTSSKPLQIQISSAKTPE